MTQGSRSGSIMDKLHRAALAAYDVIDSVAHGLAQMASFGDVRPRYEVRTRTDAEALAGDWAKVGQDLNRSIEKAKRLEGTR